MMKLTCAVLLFFIISIPSLAAVDSSSDSEAFFSGDQGMLMLDRLNLTEEQKEKVADIFKDAFAEMEQARKDYGEDRLQMAMAIRQILIKMDGRITGVLTDEQLVQYRKLKGRLKKIIAGIIMKNLEEYRESSADFSGIHLPQHMLNFSYSKVPSPSWNSDQYHASAADIFNLAGTWYLANLALYRQYNTFRNKDFPRRLFSLGDGIFILSDWITLGVGAAFRSDELIFNARALNIFSLALFRVYQKGPHSIRIGAIYSSKGEFGEYRKISLPIPLFSYQYVSSKVFVSIGLPLAVVWRPVKDLSIKATGMLPLNGTLTLRYRACPYFSFQVEYQHKKEPFYLNNFPYEDWRYIQYEIDRSTGRDRQYRVYILDRNIAGLRMVFSIEQYVDLFVYNGYQFGSFHYFSSSTTKTRVDGKKKLANAYIFSAGATVKFEMGESNVISQMLDFI